MKKSKIITLACLLLMSWSIKAQTMTNVVKAKSYGMISPMGGKGLAHYGFIGKKEIFNLGNNFKVFEGDVEVNKDFLAGSYNKNDAVKLAFKGKELLFIRTDNSMDQAPIFIQTFDANLQPKGKPFKIGELGVTLGAGSKGSTGSISKRTVEFEASWDQTTGNILVSCHVGSYGVSIIRGGRPKSSTTPYVKLILLDQNFNVLSTFAQESTEDGSEIEVVSSSVAENGDGVSIIHEISKNVIKRNFFVHVSKDNEAVLKDIQADKPTVLSSKMSLNSKNDMVAVTILSQDQDVDKKKCYVGVYNYNLKTQSVERKSYELSLDNLNLPTMDHFKWLNIDEVQKLEDGSTLVYLNSTVTMIDNGREYTQSHGLIFLKIQPNGELAWVTPIEKLDRGYIGVHDMNDVITYLNNNGELEVVFNVGRTFLKNETYKIGNSKGAPWINQMGGNIPMKTTINLESGAPRYEALKFGGKKVTCLYVGESQKQEVPGKYIMRLFIDGDAFNTMVDFTE